MGLWWIEEAFEDRLTELRRIEGVFEKENYRNLKERIDLVNTIQGP